MIVHFVQKLTLFSKRCVVIELIGKIVVLESVFRINYLTLAMVPNQGVFAVFSKNTAFSKKKKKKKIGPIKIYLAPNL